MNQKDMTNKTRIQIFFDVLGRLFYIISTSLMIIFAGGGKSFINKPVGVIYLILWILWWVITFIGRQRGEDTKYDKGQKMIVTISGIVSVPFLIIVPSWEYSFGYGPLPRDGVLSWIGLGIFASGIILQAIAMWQLRGFYTVRLGIQPEHRLITTGLYRLLRHPGYLSYLISILGIGLSLSSFVTLVFLLFIVVFIRWRIKGEEEMLLAEFGDQYRMYMKRTKRLIPFIY
ncbi:MAG: isoprenylcysteine carboxylmethyltransferase family protein [Eubacteriaceae bacterium]|nr:isoprenylcysteine carboxylmethyltransferase family protein [Eubacteriaceae bacterium]